jgi:sortase (surface protein transpeptidase)
MSYFKRMQLTGLVIVVAGLLMLAPIGYFWLQNKVALANPGVNSVPAVAPIPQGITGKPNELRIPTLHMDLRVIDGDYNPNNGQWTLTLDKAQFALPSVQPNNVSGNTLIYGHYRPEVFAYLHLIQPGAQAEVFTTNGFVFTYSYYATKAYDPTDTSIFLYKGPPRLTIQTCSGSFFQHRQMYYFKYISYAKAR